MKKFFKVSLCFVLAFCMLFTVTGCGGSKDDKKNLNFLKISIFEGGYSIDWLKTIAENFSAYYSDMGEVYNVKVEGSPLGERSAEIKAGSCSYDIVFQVGTMFKNTAYIHDLTDVYNSVPEGETKTIKEKLNPAYSDYLNIGTEEDPLFNQMIWADGKMGIVYNETVMNKYLVDEQGKPDWKIPNTTDELLSLCQRLKDAGIWAFVNCNNLGTYTVAVLDTWWAQYEGWDAYMNYYEGKPYKNDKPSSDVVNQQGRLESLKVFEQIFKKDNGFMNKDSDAYSFTDAQTELVGIRVDGNKIPSAMMVNGEWVENEASAFLKASGETIKFMPIPVISALGTKLGLTDKQLSELVELSRGIREEVSFTYTQDQFNAVKEASKLMYVNGNQHVAVCPKNSKKLDLAKKFLVYLYSDQAQSIYSRRLNGITMPYGFDPISAGITPTDFVSSALEQKDVKFLYNNDSSILVYKGGLIPWHCNDHSYLSNLDSAFFTGNKTAEEVFNGSADYVKNQWDTLLSASGF